MSENEALPEISEHDRMMALAIASAFSRLLKEEHIAVQGAAIAVTLGEWVARFASKPEIQEKALDRILLMAAKAAKAATDHAQ
jgi:hypothetical protein